MVIKLLLPRIESDVGPHIAAAAPCLFGSSDGLWPACADGWRSKGLQIGGKLSKFTEGKRALRQLPPIRAARRLRAGGGAHQSKRVVQDLGGEGLTQRLLRLRDPP
jgi:hypothetical protein